jgi:hypothetical protein
MATTAICYQSITLAPEGTISHDSLSLCQMSMTLSANARHTNLGKHDDHAAISTHPEEKHFS